MEYPTLDRGLGLLIRMHRSLEEVRAREKGEAWLEFRENPNGSLTVHPITIDAGAATRGEELRLLNADAGNLLRFLEADGYVEFDSGEGDGPSPSGTTGFVAFTKKGLDRVRYRKAFESNLPRSFKRWGGLPGSFLSPYLWRTNWEGLSILVKNKVRLAASWDRLRSREVEVVTEYLNVDGRFPSGYRVTRTRTSKDLCGELRSWDGVVREVHAHIGLTSPWLKVGCLIAVDGVIIGGDIGKRFVT